MSYGITNVARAKADAKRILEIKRKHWSIENRLHYRRDVTFREDVSQVRTGGAPEVLAALNGGLLAVMDYKGVKNIAKQMRYFVHNPEKHSNGCSAISPSKTGKLKSPGPFASSLDIIILICYYFFIAWLLIVALASHLTVCCALILWKTSMLLSGMQSKARPLSRFSEWNRSRERKNKTVWQHQ